MFRFAAITLTMTALLGAGLVAGGGFAWAALAFITFVTLAMDRVAALAAPDAPEGAEFPAGTALSAALGLLHLPLLFGGTLALAASSGDIGANVAAFLALGLFLGQVSNANAHELIHRGDRRLRALGVAVYVTLLFGHHVSAHRRVHHVWAATDRDPNSARLGESFWAFAPRAWIGSFRAGLAAETDLRSRSGHSNTLHPYSVYLGGGIACLAAVALAGGPRALALYLGLCGWAQLQLLLSDYVQHYGLRRRETAPGRFEPVGPGHSWNAPHFFSSALMLNAPRHSDHHAHPGRAYPGLRLDRDTMPMLPRGLPAMATLALVPPLWRRVMDRRVTRLQPSATFPDEAPSDSLRA